MTDDGVFVIPQGRLCTACLVGDWPHTHLRWAQTLCATCSALDTEVARRAGVRRTSAGRAASTGFVLSLEHPDRDPEWAPIRRAWAHRDARLVDVFATAASLGVAIGTSTDAAGHVRQVVAVDDLRRAELLPKAMEVRVRRFTQWLADLAPDEHAQRAASLADVDGLAEHLRRGERDARITQAQVRLEDAERAAARAPDRVARARAELERALAESRE